MIALMRAPLVFLLSIAAWGDDTKPVFQRRGLGAHRETAYAGYSSAKLDVLRTWMNTQPTTAMMVVVGRSVLFE
jgi:hypothetical protein